jgi:hypothetical protein
MGTKGICLEHDEKMNLMRTFWEFDENRKNLSRS